MENETSSIVEWSGRLHWWSNHPGTIMIKVHILEPRQIRYIPEEKGMQIVVKARHRNLFGIKPSAGFPSPFQNEGLKTCLSQVC